ncbi:uncharacterized protein LOC121388540 isoform X2 [Gigantopelta aegis]|uniref:uncharacterized protein LOC121388540 isoform X2 n=2 Tax=Gigantopelta aegis TaxID=1735272 RepID=UPI001B88B78B|nr:uncharacterized protein LOC121388540 isoform X2 [Gigantopelta aegis]
MAVRNASRFRSECAGGWKHVAWLTRCRKKPQLLFLSAITTLILFAVHLQYVGTRHQNDAIVEAQRDEARHQAMFSLLSSRNPFQFRNTSLETRARDDNLKIENVFYTRSKRKEKTEKYHVPESKNSIENSSPKHSIYEESAKVHINNSLLKTLLYLENNSPDEIVRKQTSLKKSNVYKQTFLRDVYVHKQAPIDPLLHPQASQKDLYVHKQAPIDPILHSKTSLKDNYNPTYHLQVKTNNQSISLNSLKKKYIQYILKMLRKNITKAFNAQHNLSIQKEKPVKIEPRPQYKIDTPVKTCSEKQNFAFLKVHKCGSSTVANVIQRFVLERDLNVVLPFKPRRVLQYNYLGYGSLFDKTMVIPPPRGETFNVLYNHVVYNRKTFHKLLPNNTFYFAIVREPVSKFLSAIRFFRVAKRITKDVYFRKFGVKNANVSSSNLTQEDLEPSVMSDFLHDKVLLRMYSKHRFICNSMAYDFGIPQEYTRNLPFVLHYIKQLESDFQFVMVMEYFDESLILLKRYLCWDHKTILYVPKLSVSTVPSNTKLKSSDLTSEETKIIKEWQSVDTMIYNHFNQSFWRHVSLASPDFFNEVRQFKHIRKAVAAFCERKSSLESSLFIEQSVWNAGFLVSRDDCILILSSELRLHEQLLDKAVAKIINSKGVLMR